MECNYKTLVLVDDSLSVEKGNQEIIKAVLAYLFEHAGKEDGFALAVFGETVDYAADYGTDRKSLIKSVNELTFTDKNTCLADALMETLREWQQADFACRNILLVTDGLTEESILYPKEELYFMLDKTDYPVYVIGCVQENSRAVMKELAAIARISGGQIFYTEFADSEAEVERKIGDGLLEAMQERRILFSEQEEAEAYKAKEANSEIPFQTAIISENEIMISENEETAPVIYDLSLAPEQNGRWNSDYVPVLFGVVFILALLFAASCILIKKNKNRKTCEKKFMESLQNEVKRRSSHLTGGDESCGVTQSLFRKEESAGDYNATRLLFEQTALRDILLEDRSDPTKLFRASCKDKLVLGRGENRCDVVINYDSSVSGRHCELYLRGEQWFVRDLQSSNGTWVNDRKVYQETELYSGDILKMGQLEFFVKIKV
ncbi:MAG: FHA domain-containing protein [Lachnospiraceae bacterium]